MAANHPQARHGATEVSFISRSAFELFLFHILHKFLIINGAAAARAELIYNVSVHYSDQKATPRSCHPWLFISRLLANLANTAGAR